MRNITINSLYVNNHLPNDHQEVYKMKKILFQTLIVFLSIQPFAFSDNFNQNHKFQENKPFDYSFLIGTWEGNRHLINAFGFQSGGARLDIVDVLDRRFTGTIAAIDPGVPPLVAAISGVIMPDGQIYAAVSTGGMVFAKVMKDSNNKWKIFGPSLNAGTPNEQFPFFPLANVLELEKVETY